MVTLVYGFIAAVDPHDHLPWSVAAERALVNGNQRFSYPSVARNPTFDGFVLGTSTTRLLEPGRLSQKLGGRFANLSMNSATAYEQARLYELIVQSRSESKLRTVIVGMDISWCRVSDTLKQFTFRHFPQWLYDDSAWNDYLHIFNAETLEQAAKQVQFWRGHLEPKYRGDGYQNFLPPTSQYDLTRARTNIYGQSDPKPKVSPQPVSATLLKQIPSWRYPAHSLLEGLIANTPSATRVVLLFVPYHWFHQAAGGTKLGEQWSECKRRVVRRAQRRPGTLVLDFMIDSPLTRNDESYWDKIHYGVEAAAQIVDETATALSQPVSATASANVLARID